MIANSPESETAAETRQTAEVTQPAAPEPEASPTAEVTQTEKPGTIIDLECDAVFYRIVLPDSGSDYIQKLIAERRRPYELEMLQDMTDWLSEGDLMLDIGANIGNHSLYMAAVAGCHVVAYEPNRHLATALTESVRLNRLDERLSVRALGVGARPTIAHFSAEIASNLGSQQLALGEGDIEVVTLDDQNFGKKVSAIKIDVEGMELDVLQGARELITRDQPILYVECATEAEFRQLKRFMRAQNYHYWDTFNFTATHLFLPDAMARREDRVEQLRLRGALEAYRSTDELRWLRATLSEVNAKYRVQSQQLVDRSKSLQLATQLADSAKRDRDHALAGADAAGAREQAAKQAQAEAEARERTHVSQIAALEQAGQRLREELAGTRTDAAARAAADEAALDVLRQKQAKTRDELAQLQERARRQDSELTRLRSALTMTERRLRETQGQNSKLQTRLMALVGSRTYRAGEALRDGSSSLRGLIAMPLRLVRVMRSQPDPNPVPARFPAPAPEALSAPPAKAADAEPSGPATQPAPAAALQPAPITAPLFLPGYEPPRKQVPAEGAASVTDLLPAPRRQLRIAAIMDGFTLTCYAPEAEILELTAGNWQQEIAEFRPDFLFVESAWRGKDNSWDRKIGHRSRELHELVDWCRKNRVPTVFWNKEDPVHYATFLNTARLFDAVFTTDIDCIHLYRRALEHDRVWLLPFACQPRIHNPIETFERKDAINFAGAYYTRYPERTRDLENFTAGLPALKPLDIFDRNYGKDDPNYAFPDSFQPFIVGTLPPDRIDVAYKGYSYAINLNSVKQSQSMFARRVYELLASNTVTISNYSRGLRMMFGDLVISSDDCGELTRRFRTLLDSENGAARLRLAALRKIMSEHTSADRLDYIAAKVLPGRAPMAVLPAVTVLARASDAEAARRLLAQFAAQSLPDRHLLLELPPDLSPDELGQGSPDGDARITLIAAGKTGTQALPGQGWIACWDERDHYGPNYLYDLALATRYSDADVIGKAAHHRGTGEPVDAAAAYVPVAALARRRALLRGDRLAASETLPGLLDAIGDGVWQGKALSTDPFNYCADAVDFAGIGALVDDLHGLDSGLPLARIQELAEAIPAAAASQSAGGFDVEALTGLFRGVTGKNLRVLAASGRFEVMSDLEDGKHEYIYARSDMRLRDLLRDGVLKCYVDTTPGLTLSLVVLWLDSGGQRLGSAVLDPLRNLTVTPPEGTVRARLGLRALGSGACQLRGVELGHRDLGTGEILDRAHVLVLSNHYPSYSDLYRNGFLHSRLRRYADHGLRPSVYRFRENQALSFDEFENIDVMTGDAAMLDRMLSHGHYDTVAVHFLSPAMWEVLERHIDRVRVVVWAHGFEIQPWTRRRFNFLTAEAIERARPESDARMAFWRRILRNRHPNLKMVFVSHHFAETVMEDLGFRIDPEGFEVIHNPIDTGIFRYVPKTAEQRSEILIIKSFATRMYANDLVAEAILKLSEKPFFSQLNFRIFGDGPLYDECVAPLHDLPNVELNRVFLTHAEIAEQHRRAGIFLVPSRLDTHGVSRDEAMASGLVPVTSSAGAIPEFVDESCGILTPYEDTQALADAIERLYQDPDLFLRLSEAAARRVREQSDAGMIIRLEVAVLSPKDSAEAQAQG